MADHHQADAEFILTLQTGETYVEIGEIEAAEACFSKGLEYSTRVLYSRDVDPGSAQLQEWTQQIIELYIARICNAWRLSQQVRQGLYSNTDKAMRLHDMGPYLAPVVLLSKVWRRELILLQLCLSELAVSADPRTSIFKIKITISKITSKSPQPQACRLYNVRHCFSI